jgi:ribulose-phosphate 3-epimerase
MSHLIAPSLLACDFANLGREVDMINDSQADWIHCDIMDGVFVPNISFGLPVLKSIKKIAKKPLDVHLMITNPDKLLVEFKNAGADILTVHYEACHHLHRTVSAIKQLGMKAAVCLNPHSPVTLLNDILAEVDMILIMSVNPGFGGQKFIENTYKKVSELREICLSRKLNPMIQVDGGVDITNARKLVDVGVNVLVTGSSVFSAIEPISMIRDLKNC